MCLPCWCNFVDWDDQYVLTFPPVCMFNFTFFVVQIMFHCKFFHLVDGQQIDVSTVLSSLQHLSIAAGARYSSDSHRQQYRLTTWPYQFPFSTTFAYTFGSGGSKQFFLQYSKWNIVFGCTVCMKWPRAGLVMSECVSACQPVHDLTWELLDGLV